MLISDKMRMLRSMLKFSTSDFSQGAYFFALDKQSNKNLGIIIIRFFDLRTTFYSSPDNKRVYY